MATTGTFTGLGVSGAAIVATPGDAAFAITGTFVGTLLLERSILNGYAWITLATFTGPAADLLPSTQCMQFRFRCVAFTSGTVNYSITPPPPPSVSIFGSLPTTNPGAGSGLAWLNGGVVCVA
jgi:hypothetical protein